MNRYIPYVTLGAFKAKSDGTPKTPKRAENIPEVPENTIRELAREMASHRNHRDNAHTGLTTFLLSWE